MLQEGAQVAVRFFSLLILNLKPYMYMTAQPLPIGVFGMGIDNTKITLLP